MDVDIHLGDEHVQFLLFKQPPHVDEDVDVDIHLGDEHVHLGMKMYSSYFSNSHLMWMKMWM